LQAYERAFAAGEGGLAKTIADALPLEAEAARAAGTHLAHYVGESIRSLEKEPLAALRAGTLSFPEIYPRHERRSG